MSEITQDHRKLSNNQRTVKSCCLLPFVYIPCAITEKPNQCNTLHFDPVLLTKCALFLRVIEGTSSEAHFL